MIDRKALWISGLIFLAMTAAALWRISLLPDWHHMALSGPGDKHPVRGLILFVPPASVLFMSVLFFARKWFVSGPIEAVQPHVRLANMVVISNAALCGALQAFVIARSLGFGMGIDRLAFSHVGLVLTGIMVMIVGNVMPKMPWLLVRLRPLYLDPWQWNRQMRFMGRLMVAFGLFMAVVGPLLPPKLFTHIIFGLWLAIFLAGVVYRIMIRRETSPLA